MAASWNEFRRVLASAIFWNSFRRIGIDSSLNVWQNSPVVLSGYMAKMTEHYKPAIMEKKSLKKKKEFACRSHLILDFSLLEVLKSQFQFHYLWLVYSYFLFLLGSVLDNCTLLRICPFVLGCQFYWYIIAHSSLLWAFVFLW